MPEVLSIFMKEGIVDAYFSGASNLSMYMNYLYIANP